MMPSHNTKNTIINQIENQAMDYCEQLIATFPEIEVQKVNNSGLRLLTSKLALYVHYYAFHDSCEGFRNIQQMNNVNDSTFSPEQEKLFAKMQIYCNNKLRILERLTIPLLHLAPSMINVNISNCSQSENVDSMTINNTDKLNQISEQIPQTIKAKKRKNRSKKNKTASIEEIQTTRKPEDSIDNLDKCIAFVRTKVSLSKSDQEKIITSVINNISINKNQYLFDIIKNICDLYESEISNIREHHEDSIRNLQLRLMISETNLENRIRKQN